MATAHRRPVLSPPQGPLPTTLPRLQPDLDFNDTTLFAVYCFIKNFVGVANNTSAIIDTKIEKAMDLVKSHLMYTVREEVQVLKERIAELLDRINQLERENSFLRANVSAEVLNTLNNRAPQDQAQGNVLNNRPPQDQAQGNVPPPPTTSADGGASSK